MASPSLQRHLQYCPPARMSKSFELSVSGLHPLTLSPNHPLKCQPLQWWQMAGLPPATCQPEWTCFISQYLHCPWKVCPNTPKQAGWLLFALISCRKWSHTYIGDWMISHSTKMDKAAKTLKLCGCCMGTWRYLFKNGKPISHKAFRVNVPNHKIKQNRKVNIWKTLKNFSYSATFSVTASMGGI